MGALEERTRFEPAEVEPRIVQRWLDSGLVHPEPGGSPAENFSIAVPPPNVTGVLHMGHALNGAIQDVLVRSNRMRGRRTKWILGTDHAGIATQRQVEKRLIEEGTSREAARPRGVRRARVALARGARRSDHRPVQAPRRDARLRGRALHDGRALRGRGAAVFVELYEQGLIYRDNYMVNWDPGLKLGDLRPRGRGARGDRRHDVLDRLPAGFRRGRARDRDRAPGDAARRHRRRRAPRRRALRGARRPAR